jgi:hypothetical protein
MDAGHEYYKKYVRLLAQVNDRSIANLSGGKNIPADIAYELSKLNNSGV